MVSVENSDNNKKAINLYKVHPLVLQISWMGRNLFLFYFNTYQSSKFDFRIYWPENFKIRIFI